MSNLGPPGLISCFTSYRTQSLEGPPFEPPTSAPTSGKCQCAGQGVPLTPTRCNPVAFGFKTRESVSKLGTPGLNFVFYIV